MEQHEEDRPSTERLLVLPLLRVNEVLGGRPEPLRLLQGLQHRPRLLGTQAVHRQTDLDSREAGGRPDARALEGIRRLRIRAVGGPYPLVGLNNSGSAERMIAVDTGFGPGVALHDYTGHRPDMPAPDIHTDGSGRATLIVPRN
jgi:hypothetical protein